MASILPVRRSRATGQLEFLFGKEQRWNDTPGWSDFGGGIEPGESPRAAAAREAREELCGFLGSRADIDALLRSAVVVPGPVPAAGGKPYLCHLVRLKDMDDDVRAQALVEFFNKNAKFVREHVGERELRRSKIYEKAKIQWFTADDMRAQRASFRPFYRPLLDTLGGAALPLTPPGSPSGRGRGR